MIITNLINEKQAAQILSWSIQTLRNDRATKRRIPFVKLGRSVRYRPEDINAFIEQHRIGGDSHG